MKAISNRVECAGNVLISVRSVEKKIDPKREVNEKQLFSDMKKIPKFIGQYLSKENVKAALSPFRCHLIDSVKVFPDKTVPNDEAVTIEIEGSKSTMARASMLIHSACPVKLDETTKKIKVFVDSNGKMEEKSPEDVPFSLEPFRNSRLSYLSCQSFDDQRIYLITK